MIDWTLAAPAILAATASIGLVIFARRVRGKADKAAAAAAAAAAAREPPLPFDAPVIFGATGVGGVQSSAVVGRRS